jgi:hypothetical protein
MMKREKYVIIEDINSTDDVDHVVLENDVFIDDYDEREDKTCCFNNKLIKRFLDLLSYYFD